MAGAPAVAGVTFKPARTGTAFYLLPATPLTVTTTAASGASSLRAALTTASNTAGLSTILFNIPVTDPGYNATGQRRAVGLRMPAALKWKQQEFILSFLAS